jgi:hypothetical protein
MNACLACWHHAIGRCVRCLRKDPTAGSAPPPWENRALPFVARFAKTFVDAFRPTSTANGLARPELGPAIVFAVITALPFAMLRGIVPYTKTLLFGFDFAVAVQGGAGSSEIAIDVARAAGLGVAVTAAQLLALALPFASLARAYGAIPGHRAAMRLMLYRAWLLTVSMNGVVYYFGVWASPEAHVEIIATALKVFELFPAVALFIAMRATARLAHGVGPFMSMVVVFLPLVLLVLTQLTIDTELAGFLPAPPAASE